MSLAEVVEVAAALVDPKKNKGDVLVRVVVTEIGEVVLLHSHSLARFTCLACCK
jgi:hypothetical protein